MLIPYEKKQQNDQINVRILSACKRLASAVSVIESRFSTSNKQLNTIKMVRHFWMLNQYVPGLLTIAVSFIKSVRIRPFLSVFLTVVIGLWLNKKKNIRIFK
jgi:hypothetical protein